MRRYELMLILRPDVADDKAQAVIDRTTRQVSAGGGQIVKVPHGAAAVSRTRSTGTARARTTSSSSRRRPR